MFGHLLDWFTIYTFSGALARNRILLCPILAALQHSTRAMGISESLQRRTRIGTKELSQRTPRIFSWAAITLGIGPHSTLEQGVPELLEQHHHYALSK